MSDLSRISSTFRSVQTIVSGTVMVGALVATCVLGWQSLQDKPTRGEVDLKIAAGSAERLALGAVIEEHSRQIKHMLKVQEYQIAQSSWQGEVLDHIAQRRKGLPRKRPEHLQRLANALMSPK